MTEHHTHVQRMGMHLILQHIWWDSVHWGKWLGAMPSKWSTQMCTQGDLFLINRYSHPGPPSMVEHYRILVSV